MTKTAPKDLQYAIKKNELSIKYDGLHARDVYGRQFKVILSDDCIASSTKILTDDKIILCEAPDDSQNIGRSQKVSVADKMSYSLGHELGHQAIGPVELSILGVLCYRAIRKSFAAEDVTKYLKPLALGTIAYALFVREELADMAGTAFHDLPFYEHYYPVLYRLADEAFQTIFR